MITLEVHICDQRRSYLGRFSTEDQAIDFINRKKSTHAIHEVDGFPVSDEHQRLLEVLHPTCEHGLSANLCMGSTHYAADF